MSKAFMGFLGLALVAALIGYMGGMTVVTGLARVVAIVSAGFALIALTVGRSASDW